MSSDLVRCRRHITAREQHTITLQQRVASNQYDTEAWELLINELWANRRYQNYLERLVTSLREVVEKFPTAGRHWQMLVEIELDNGNLPGAMELFGRCLPRCYNVGLWKTYIRFIQTSNERKGDEGKREVMQAFEYVLEREGQASGAGSLWLDFLHFLLSIPIQSSAFRLLFEPEPGHEQSKRALRVREVFLQALQVPSDELDQIWADYERFETGGPGGRNSSIAMRFVEDARPRFLAAKDSWATRKQLLSAVDESALPWTPGKSPPSGRFAEQRRAWRELIEYEKSNPQALDRPLLRKRVDLAYQQMLQPLGRCPELWYEWARAWDGDASEARGAHASRALTAARVALPDCIMFAFALADIYEANKQRAEALKVYEEVADALEKGEGGVSLSPDNGSLVWIQFMLFQARSGTPAGHQEARRVFIRARKWPQVQWHVFAFHALLEWQLQRADGKQGVEQCISIVKRIFDLGMQNPAMASAPAYIHVYTQWLAGAIGDVSNARIIFQTAAESEALLDSTELLTYMLEFESKYGTPQDIAAVDERWAALRTRQEASDALPSPFELLARRYKHLGLWPCTAEQQRYIHGLLPALAGQDGSAQGTTDVPAALALFLSKLPPLEVDQPVPDVDFIVSLVLEMGSNGSMAQQASSNGKRLRDSTQSVSQYSDIYQLRQKLKVEGLP